MVKPNTPTTTTSRLVAGSALAASIALLRDMEQPPIQEPRIETTQHKKLRLDRRDKRAAERAARKRSKK